MDSDTYQLLDVGPRQSTSFTLTRRSLTRPSSVDGIEEQNSTIQDDPKDQPSTQPPGWSSQPRRLDKTTQSFFLDTTLNVVMVLLSVPFLILAAAVVSVHGQEVEQSRSRLETLTQATKTARPPCVFSY